MLKSQQFIKKRIQCTWLFGLFLIHPALSSTKNGLAQLLVVLSVQSLNGLRQLQRATSTPVLSCCGGGVGWRYPNNNWSTWEGPSSGYSEESSESKVPKGWHWACREIHLLPLPPPLSSTGTEPRLLLPKYPNSTSIRAASWETGFKTLPYLKKNFF